MVKLYDQGAYLVNGTEIVEDTPKAQAEIAAKTGRQVSKEEGSKRDDRLWDFEGTQCIRQYGAPEH